MQGKIEPFKGGTKSARSKLNALVADHNNIQHGISLKGKKTNRQLPPVPLYFGKIIEQYDSACGYFVGTFFNTNGDLVGLTSPFYQVQVNCQFAEVDNAYPPNMFLAFQNNLDLKYYCIGVYSEFIDESSESSRESSQSSEESTGSSAESSSSSSAAADLEPGINWVILQETLQTDGKISVKLLDAAGTATGDAFDVWAFPGHTTGLTVGDWMWSTFTAPAADDKVLIASDQHGEWYIIQPTLFKQEECPEP